jgi:glutathione S-transferase
MVWGVYAETVEGPARGRPPDDNRLAAASKMASRCLLALERLAPESPWLAGDALTLADLHAAPM